jgi:hypothetical protein
MDQQIQEAYLGAMGVPLWFPRYSLPNAPELSWPVSESTNVVHHDDAGDASVEVLKDPGVSLSKLKSLMGEDEAQESNSESTLERSTLIAPVSLASNKVQTQDLVEPFAFLFFRYPLGVTIAVSLPVEESLSSVESRFLESVLVYLGVETHPEFSHRVDWPLVKTNKAFYTREFFEGSMSALFEKQALSFGANTFLLFGKRLSDELSELLLSMSSKDQDIHVISSFELPTLFMSAKAKRELWTQLRAMKSHG